MDNKNFKDIAILFGVIVIAAIGARTLAGGETLTDYAKKNPEVAGVTVEQAQLPEPDNKTQNNLTSFSRTEAEKRNSDSTSANVESTDTSGNTSATGLDNPSKSSSENSSDTASTDSTTNKKDNTSSAPADDRTTYKEGFYYEPISNEIFSRISGISYPVDCTVPLDELRYVVVQYVDFNGDSQSGELICNKALAGDMVEIFYELYTSDYQIESIKLIDEFNGDDTASMLANNSSCFNYRVVEGTTRLSNHATGRAIDINPFYNPYITYNKDGSTKISPEGSEPYADRSAQFPYKIDENDLAYKLFRAHGFKWGGDWNSVKDFQHFEKK